MKLKKHVIAMVHVEALPGTPHNSKTIDRIVAAALSDARILQEEGVDAIMIENMHDRPYLNREVGPEIISSMTAVACALRSEIQLPLGIQILAGANKAALAVALAAGFDFIRAEGFVFGHLADEGMMNSDAGDLLRYRKMIGAEHLSIFTDIKKKHSSHALSADVSIAETARAAAFFLSDGVIVTGTSTGEKASVEQLVAVRNAVDLPLLIGSGIDENNIAEYWPLADAFIVGSSLKQERRWDNSVEREKASRFMKEVKRLRV